MLFNYIFIVKRSDCLKRSIDFIDKYKRFIDKGWIVKISKSKLDRWINNFGDNLDCAHFLLDALVFYKESQIISIIKELQNVMQSQLYSELQSKNPVRLCDKELFNFWEVFIKKTCLIAVAKPDNAAGSGHQALRLWRDNSRFVNASIIKLEENISAGCNNIFFVDDFIGTGTRIDQFLSDNILDVNFHPHNVIDVVAKHPEIKFGVITFVAYKKSLETLMNKYPNINFISSEIFDNTYNLLSEDCLFFADFEDEKKSIIEYIREKKACIKTSNDYALNLSLAFEYGFPNNSLELYWTEEIENWCNLIKHRRSY